MALFIGLFALWLLWSGLYKPLVIGLGAVSCLLCVWLTQRMNPVGGALRAAPALRLLGYLPWLIKEIALANWTVIRIVLSRQPAIRPVVVTVTGSQRCELARVIYGNSITLTPGTLTMDVDGDRLTVHALTRDGARQLEDGEMDARVTRLEGPA